MQPSQMQPVVTTMSGKNLHIDWIMPSENGSPISAYKILIVQSNGVTQTESTTYCDGSNFVVIANRFCEIPMSVLIAAPYSLPQGQLIKVTAYAINSVGSGTPSALNSVGELAQVPPLKPPTPPTRNSGTTQYSIMVDYAILTGTYTGGSTVLSLNLQWD